MFDMAIGNIFGANIYNIFLLAAADLIYLPGPLLQSVSSGHLLTIMMAIILTSIASTGLVYCSKRCVGRLGINSVFILLGYFTAAAVLFFTRTG